MSSSPGDRYRQVAALHATSIDQGVLATLGLRFLALMYRAIDTDARSVLLTEERDGKVVGFVTGGQGMGSIYRRMLMHPFRLAWAILPSLVRPARIGRMLDILCYSAGKKAPTRPWPEAELLSLAVDPSARGTGIAEQLYRRLEVYFRKQGVPAFRIIVGKTLAPAHRFYRRMGAQEMDSIEVHAGESSTVYVHQLKPQGESNYIASMTCENPLK